MKIRQGFVSNSSSSSFIISDEYFPTVRDLAKYMLKQKIREYEYDDYEYKKEYTSYDKKLIKKLDKIDKNQSVSFPSCNYDTYIKKIGDQYFVATCNNTDWNLYAYTSKLSDISREELNLLLKKYEENSDEYVNINSLLEENSEFYRFDNDYYDLDKDIVGVEIYEHCPNENKHDKYTYLWDTPKYGKICLICNPVFKRKEKLEIINKKSK